ncbi:uncharacterized protein EI90DRAFT_3122335 [Cantharellus anzutake]|uniref:uncharacterized protein n=1 Tax=Cantharellus anzutake TaxID=1750568 RepID=UPI001905886B|nr:uncharacterized protein EI90DRAFT_3122335 [Cantharellus anzutake]KAF8332572.1 hypothetical protein EI90DRAFT_3122335 [Cantharellus anzutake]
METLLHLNLVSDTKSIWDRDDKPEHAFYIKDLAHYTTAIQGQISWLETQYNKYLKFLKETGQGVKTDEEIEEIHTNKMAEIHSRSLSYLCIPDPDSRTSIFTVISIPGHRLPVPPIPPVYLRSFFTNLGAPVFRNPLGTPRWSPPPPFNLLPMPP